MADPTMLSFEPSTSAVALVIGNFDGVHRGHQALIAHVVELARDRGLSLKVMTFEPHPAVALGGTVPPVLTTLQRKIELLESLAPNLRVIVQRFDRAFAQLRPEEFVERILVGGFCVRELIVGQNFRFGRDRAGSVETLQLLGARYGFTAHAFGLEGDAAGAFSSSRARQLLQAGDLAEANRLLGRHHAICGVVGRGDGRGRTIGVPTANLEDIEELRPRVGVYACRVELIEGESVRDLGAAVANLGPRPTVDRGDAIEVHILDCSLDLYGQKLRVSFIARLREQRRFADLDALKRQIATDIAAARQIVQAAAS